MTVFVMRNGQLMDKALAEPAYTGPKVHIISDIMEPTRHMATNRMHTSKSEFRKDTKASGCLELGNDAALTRPRKPVPLDRAKQAHDIRQAIEQLRQRS